MITGLIAAVVVALGGLWWFSGHDTYQVYTAETVTIAGASYPVRRFEGVAVPGSPELTRACFRIDEEVRAPPELNPRPNAGPPWFKCFSARFIAEQLASEDGKAYLAESDDPVGYDRVIAVLPGRRVYMWRQPN